MIHSIISADVGMGFACHRCVTPAYFWGMRTLKGIDLMEPTMVTYPLSRRERRDRSWEVLRNVAFLESNDILLSLGRTHRAKSKGRTSGEARAKKK